MFTGFFFHLRSVGLKVGLTEWLAVTAALARGHDRASLAVFYHLCRSLVVKREAQYDLYDRAFAAFFGGVDEQFVDVDAAVLEWLEDPVMPRDLSDEERRALEGMDLDTLRTRFEERLRTQRERHDGGDRFVGTGGTSPFGHGGQHPSGVGVGAGGGRSAVQVAEERRFENLRGDRVLDTRQIGSALRRLRRLAREQGPEELDVDETVDKAAKNAGEIELVMRPPRKNRVKLLLLMDVGGSMDPYADVCERIFSAAHQASHFAAFQHYFFHNCVYERLYTDITRYAGPRTEDVLKQIDRTWTVVLVGDAWMGPYELTHENGGIYWQSTTGRVSGLDWLKRIAGKPKASAWLNPEPKRVWNAPTVSLIRRVFPMFELTLDGLSSCVDHLRGARPVLAEPGSASR